MNLGAIVILDALGFKGIWAREDPNAVLKRLKDLRSNGLSLQGRDRSGVLVCDSGFINRVRFMSDTIVVTVMVKGPKAPIRGLYKAMESATMIAGEIMLEAIQGSPKFLFRGCLAAGEMNTDVDFLIGPAVDEAASRFEKADGPFLWLAPSALDINQHFAETFPHDNRLEPFIILPYSVPLNDGSSIKTLTYNYHGIIGEADKRAELHRRILEAFGGNPMNRKVRAKRRNVKKFLSYVDRFARSGKWMKQFQHPFRLPEWNDLSPNQKMTLMIHEICWAELDHGGRSKRQLRKKGD